MNFVYVVAESFAMFRTVCMIDWRDNPHDRKYKVWLPLTPRRAKGRPWEPGDEIRVVGRPRGAYAAEFYAVMASIGAPADEMAKIQYLLPRD